MNLTVRDLFDIDIMKNFRLIAGEGGLSRPIEGTEILDFEFVQGAGINRDKAFEGKSITMSSLLFAKDNPELILDAVKQLNKLNVSCLAYKPVFINKLPQEVIDFADKNNFPILEFGGDEFFDDVILSVVSEINKGSEAALVEETIEKILDKEISPKDENKFARRINTEFKRFIQAAAVRDQGKSPEELEEIVKRFSLSERLKNKAAICRFRDGYFIFLSQEQRDNKRFDALLEDIFVRCQVDRNNVCCGFSAIMESEGSFGKIVRESFWACIAAQIEEVSRKEYDSLGIYRLLVPQINSEDTIEYMKGYLEPVLGAENEELMKTAIGYVMSRGDVESTSKLMFCHKNTVRYRLAKLQELLSPGESDKEFYSNLSIAVKIYMLSKKR